MTAEVAILNRLGVGLAADSAVTFGATKTSTSAEKLFQLSEHAPVAAMVHGNGQLNGVPWETVIKSYRKHLRNRVFASVPEYSEDLVCFLRAQSAMFPASDQDWYLYRTSYMMYMDIAREIAPELESLREETGETPSESDVLAALSHAIEGASERLTEGANPELAKKILERHREHIELARASAFERLPISTEQEDRLASLGALHATSARYTGEFTGVVVCGFGETEYYPSLHHRIVRGVACDELLLGDHETVAITPENDSVIYPFGQRDMVETFVSGIDPGLERELQELVVKSVADFQDRLFENAQREHGEEVAEWINAHRDIMNDSITMLANDWTGIVHQKHRRPLFDIIRALPKDELGAVAESLVNLTKLKRRVTTDVESVGGPVDVAVLTKGDGFVWVKRKHYFDPTLNPRFMAKAMRTGLASPNPATSTSMGENHENP